MSTAASCLTYRCLDWGDHIVGTKEQLQELGLGVGLAFPGELGGPRYELKVRDPRGFPVTIDHSNEGRFAAWVRFPNWPTTPVPDRPWEPFAPGVKRCGFTWFDRYLGRADSLASAGLVRIDQLPGKPGMRKVCVTIFPDGTLPAPTAKCHEAGAPGTRRIERASASTYRVTVRVTEEEEALRDAEFKAAKSAWLRHVRSLPRPAKLQPAVTRWVDFAAARASAPFATTACVVLPFVRRGQAKSLGAEGAAS